jgi:hypothetical protein
METLTIRYSLSWLAMITAFGFLGATAVKLIERGFGYVVHTWSDFLFWGLMSAGLSFFALIIWAIPAARLSTERITTIAYPFRVSWNEIQRVKVSSLFGLIWLRVHGPKSRFAIWVPLPKNQLQDIYMFIQTHGGSTMTAAFSDKRLNQALQRTRFARR